MNMQQDIEEEVSPNLFATLPAILWQRRWLLVPPLVLCSAAGVATAFLLPAEYESSATVLIESAQLPSDGAGSQINDVIEERIARARERVLSRQDLIRAIRANDLYPREQERKPLSEIVERMRKSTAIQAVGIDDGNGLRATGGHNTIALRMSFRYDDPVKAQLVAQQYVNRFLEVDAAAAADAAVGARSFLEEQANQLRNQLNAVENQVTKMKVDNGAVLAMNERSTGDPVSDSARIDSEIAGIEAQNAQLAITSPKGGGNADVAQAEAMLRIARARYSESHPDVLAAQAQLDAARAAAGKSATTPDGPNPQIVANRAQIAALRTAKGIMLATSASQKAAAAQAPAISGKVEQMEKQADTLRVQYNGIMARLQGAQMSERQTTEQKGERLTLSDPPVVPDRPAWPNRPMLVAAGVAAGGGIGLALVFLVELLLRPIRGVDALRSLTGAAPLALVPDYNRRPHLLIRWMERRHRRKAARPS